MAKVEEKPLMGALFPGGAADEEELEQHESRSPRRRQYTDFLRCRSRRINPSFTVFAIAIVALCLSVYSYFHITGANSRHGPAKNVAAKQWHKPAGLKVVGMVFYGRPMFVDILDCYLLRNLVVNGGYLDEIHFMTHTEKPEDLAWLDELLSRRPHYTKFSGNGSYVNIWRHATEPDTLYIKIDDDMTWVDDNAVPRLVHSLIDHPEAYGVAANLVNSPVMHWLHWHNNAIYPYLPDNKHVADARNVSWRPSELPMWRGAAPDEYDFDAQPPFSGHRWLPLNNTMSNLAKTPIANASYDAFGTGVKSWAMAAQQHYSLFENLERDQVSRYWGGGEDGIWNMWYSHYNINFLAIWGHQVAEIDFFDWWMDDEWAMSELIPKQLSKPLLVDTHSVVAHFSFHPQTEGMQATDVLGRYRSYANDRICAADNQKAALGKLKPAAAAAGAAATAAAQ